MVLLLFSPSFSADPDLCHRSGNSHWLLCGLIHFFFIQGEAKLNHHGRKSRDKIGGKEMFYVLLLDLFKILFVCLFFRLLVVSLIAFFLFFFYLFCDNLPCSGMFRNVPGCSGMFHDPGFVDAQNARTKVKTIVSNC